MPRLPESADIHCEALARPSVDFEQKPVCIRSVLCLGDLLLAFFHFTEHS